MTGFIVLFLTLGLSLLFTSSLSFRVVPSLPLCNTRISLKTKIEFELISHKQLFPHLIKSIKLSSCLAANNNQKVPEKEERSKNFIEIFFDSLIKIFSPKSFSKEMDPKKVVAEPAAYQKPLSISQLRQRHKKKDGWSSKDIVDNFASKFNLNKSSVYNKRTKKLLSRLYEINDEVELLESIEEYATILDKNPSDPLGASEKFIADSVMQSFSSIGVEMKKDNLVREPKRLYKPVKLSVLRKVLAKDPEYFKR